MASTSTFFAVRDRSESEEIARGYKIHSAQNFFTAFNKKADNQQGNVTEEVGNEPRARRSTKSELVCQIFIWCIHVYSKMWKMNHAKNDTVDSISEDTMIITPKT